MQLRSETFDQLKEMLSDAGVYEDGMNVREMRQLAQAMELSNESVDGRESFDMQRALRESEIDFHITVNSTMIIHPPVTPTTETANATTSNWPSHLEGDCDSPPTNPIRMTVQAVVHHELNWSPEREQRPLKRQAIDKTAGADTDCDINAKRALQEQPNRDNNQPPSPSQLLTSGDSGLNSEEEEDEYSSLSSLSGLSSHNSMPSIGEMPSRLLISTSSAVVSDLSDQHQSAHDDVDEEQP